MMLGMYIKHFGQEKSLIEGSGRQLSFPKDPGVSLNPSRLDAAWRGRASPAVEVPEKLRQKKREYPIADRVRVHVLTIRTKSAFMCAGRFPGELQVGCGTKPELLGGITKQHLVKKWSRGREGVETKYENKRKVNRWIFAKRARSSRFADGQ